MQETRTAAKLAAIEDIIKAQMKLKTVVHHTPLMHNFNLSEQYQAHIYLKREDLQVVRSYKIRGAYNKISSMTAEETSRGVVCASAGNHAQGVAFACNRLNIKGKIFMPHTTPSQKIKQVKMFGKHAVEVIITGDTFDDSYKSAMVCAGAENMPFIHPFDDDMVIAGQGTVGMEILEDADRPVDFLFAPVGGGGLISGAGSYFKQVSQQTRIIGVEPAGAPAMHTSLARGENTTLQQIDKFVDGAAVKRVGDRTFEMCRDIIEEVALVPEGKVCSTILKLYNEEAIVVEPAGALSISALDFYREQIKGKTVVCIVSGSNNDITRMEEMKERSLLYEGLKHYFMINFPQRAGALKDFVVNILGPEDDITHFEYTKKTSRENGPALVGIEVKKPGDYDMLLQRMKKQQIPYELVNERALLFNFLI